MIEKQKIENLSKQADAFTTGNKRLRDEIAEYKGDNIRKS